MPSPCTAFIPRNLSQGISVANSLGPRDPKRISRAEWWGLRTSQRQTVVLYSPSLSLKTLDTGILLLAVFTLELEMDYPSETSLCTVAPSPTDTPSPIFFWGEGAAVHRLSEMDNPSSNCPSKLMDKVRRIVHSKLKLFHFQTKTYYLSDANHQTDNQSHTNNSCLMWKWPFLL